LPRTCDSKIPIGSLNQVSKTVRHRVALDQFGKACVVVYGLSTSTQLSCVRRKRSRKHLLLLGARMPPTPPTCTRRTSPRPPSRATSSCTPRARPSCTWDSPPAPTSLRELRNISGSRRPKPTPPGTSRPLTLPSSRLLAIASRTPSARGRPAPWRRHPAEPPGHLPLRASDGESRSTPCPLGGRP
jgi:hypothetical protein